MEAERQRLEALFLAQLHWIERAAESFARRYHMIPDDVADVTSWVKVRLIEDDYAILRKFRGESSIRTYLTTVVCTLVRDYRVRHWGRWRPSAMAQRLGPAAVRLETLIARDHFPGDQAVELLLTSRQTDCSRRELQELCARLPRRDPTRPALVGIDSAEDAAGDEDPEELLARADIERERGRIGDAIREVLAQLPPEDHLLLRMRFWKQMSVADIARALGLPQKPLYRRIERLFKLLRKRLEASGLSRDRVRALLDEAVPS